MCGGGSVFVVVKRVPDLGDVDAVKDPVAHDVERRRRRENGGAAIRRRRRIRQRIRFVGS